MKDAFLEQLVADNAPALDSPAAEPAPASPSPDPASDGRARDAQGRFAPKAKDEPVDTGVKTEPQPAPQAPVTAAQPEPPSGDEGKHVPLAALNALKEKLAKVEAELAETRKPRPEQHQQPQTPQGPAYSFEDDPANYLREQVETEEQREQDRYLNISEMMAKSQYGAEAVDQAVADIANYVRTDPVGQFVHQRIMESPHPYVALMDWHKQHREYDTLRTAGGLEKLKAQWLAEMQAAGGAQPAPAQQPAAVVMPKAEPVAPPPSLVKGGGAGQSDAPQTRTDDDAFGALFDKTKRKTSKR